ncbi:class I SAM-dependent methyltransferase [Okeania sp.]|uniref:class I SAM-dependent methyltransferase n=1 Tax=Okeania sp. TaxID=3100323 RepID=UPI002B4B5FF4|nr:class I SAM-dependent methyltransferase [Okeania sp.]MEB3343622.1 class I SAM-dependent methyltransferase [Okeania sp.]
METTNNYDLYSKYYDEVSHKRYDYPAIARTIATFIGQRKTVLEIGVATGSVVQELLHINPQQYEIWGIDNNALLIEQEKAKLGSEDRVHFYVQDILDFNLE